MFVRVMGALFLVSRLAVASELDVVQGVEVAPEAYPEVAMIRVDGRGIGSAVVVGPRVLLTAAHNANEGDRIVAIINGKEWEVSFRKSALYPEIDHDLAVLVSPVEIPDAPMVSVGSPAAAGESLILIGYGCESLSTFGGAGTLRMATNVVRDRRGYDFTTSPGKEGGKAQLCPGDSGGPALRDVAGTREVVGIASKGSMSEPVSWFVDLGHSESRGFLEGISAEGYAICGINLEC